MKLQHNPGSSCRSKDDKKHACPPLAGVQTVCLGFNQSPYFIYYDTPIKTLSAIDLQTLPKRLHEPDGRLQLALKLFLKWIQHQPESAAHIKT